MCSNKIIGKINQTNVVLIPKCLEAIKVFDPFSFCKLLYKILSKLMVERMKKDVRISEPTNNDGQEDPTSRITLDH